MPDSLKEYLSRPMTPPAADVMAAIARGPIDVADALPLRDVDRMCDPAPLRAETGWCTLRSGVGFVAVTTFMPNVTGEMVDWWFHWHADDSLRYRIWHPLAHTGNSIERPAVLRVKKHWDTVHHPVEDVGVGTVRARIAFRAPSAMGMSGDYLDDPRVATIVCGFAGDDGRRSQHTPMCHVFLNSADGVVLRSAFWLGAALRPYGRVGALVGPALNNRVVRRVAMPRGLPQALATHCAEEYANLGALLPELYAKYA